MSSHRYSENKTMSTQQLPVNVEHHSNGPITFSRDSRRGSTHSNVYNSYSQQAMSANVNESINNNNNSYRDNNYTLSRNDDYVISSSRPFNTAIASSVPYRQGQLYQQQPSMSTTSMSSRPYQTQSSLYQSSLGQRSSHSIHINPNGYSQSSTATTG